jgi:hypothetical protein
LSNNLINDIISYSFPVDQDEELLGYYVSLLKMLAIRLTPDTVLFFMNEVQPVLQSLLQSLLQFPAVSPRLLL